MTTNQATTTKEALEPQTICGNCGNNLYQVPDPNNIHWYHAGTLDVRCPTRFAKPVSAPIVAPEVDAKTMAEKIADRWARHDLPLRSSIHSNPRLQLQALAEHVIHNYICAASFIQMSAQEPTSKETDAALAHAKTLNAETETVFTDGQGTWYGARLDNHPTTAAFELCAICLQVNAHEDECPEGYHPLSAPASPAALGDEARVPQTALYWLKAAKDESYSMAERLFYMENAYNHVVNALYATTPPSTAARKAAEEIASAFPEIKEQDKWVVLGRVKIDRETETETFERAIAPPMPVLDQIATIIERCFSTREDQNGE